MARTKTCTEPGCNRPQSTTVIGPKLCDPHADYYQWENTHDDEGHDDTNDWTPAKEHCPVCNGVDPATLAPKAGTTRKNQAKVTHRSHAACDHACTPRARAACRKAGGPKA